MALALLGLVLMAVGVMGALALLGEWLESRRAVRWCHTMGRHCGRASCEPCALAAESAEAAAKVGACPVLIVPGWFPGPPLIPGAFTRVT
ncbi:hypothetical protein [Actinomadura rupiterrae]|uniref:hypothetical protein n=1 Tax=Actinomadura rupiterrae TaxID=559627 RepID=UPI0020A2E121|nr:hypothetical protein [Actinomadura rupiterrae]MCP2337195.1 hypothetical protein [Actinomadura rupiterrae]